MKFTLSKFLNILIIVLILGFIIKKIYLHPKQKSGDQAPEFTGLLINEDTFNLSDLQGSYVLLDFWASWCGPCRKQNPRLVSLFQSFENETFTNASSFKIVSIGLERDRVKWFTAIKQDGLKWPYHILEESSFNGPITSLYKVKEIPQKYLINPEGMIIMVNPSVAEIHDYLSNKVKEDSDY